MRLQEIDAPESTRRRNRSCGRSEEWHWKSEARKILRNHDGAKIFATGLILLTILCSMAIFVQYSNDKMAELKSTLRASEQLWQRRTSELESRAKRNAYKIDKWSESGSHSVAKRSAPRRIEDEDVSQVNSSEEQEHDQKRQKGGAVFTRWGRRDCPKQGPSSLIYSGVVAGSHQSHTGGGANHICIHSNITYEEGRFQNGNQGSSNIYGLEYRDTAWANRLFDLRDTMDLGIQYHSVPCALCMADGRSGQVMIPGMIECPEGWIYEYDGYIMTAGHSDKHSSEHICVDKRPQVVPGTHGSQSGSHLFIVETQCTSLLCEPFVLGRELTCVVCTI